jgi:hypothetical protein
MTVAFLISDYRCHWDVGHFRILSLHSNFDLSSLPSVEAASNTSLIEYWADFFERNHIVILREAKHLTRADWSLFVISVPPSSIWDSLPVYAGSE